MRCSMCGHESPAGSSFCLNCGSSLAPAAAPPVYAQTTAAPTGLPVICGVCRGENPPGMKFCRACGSALGQSMATMPTGGGAPMVQPPSGGVLGAMGGGPMMSPAVAPTMAPQPVGSPGFSPSTAPGVMPPLAGSSPKVIVTPSAASPPPAQGSMVNCPRCGTPTPVGFAYCQQCGLHMQAMQPTDPGQSPRPRGDTGANAMRPSAAQIDPQGATLATDGMRAGSIPMPAGRAAPMSAPISAPPSAPLAAPFGAPAASMASAPVTAPAAASFSAAAGPAWGTAVLVNRDGSDGQRFPLSGEYVVVGRAGADIAFEDDRFLARQHARFERTGDGVRVHSLDVLNGVFKKADLPVDLVDGMTILVGREVLRYEKVDPEEIKVHPLIRHGVALFGSPPREPWGRFVAIVPSGGWRDVRHLAGEEIVLGREEGDIVFRDDAFMSRRHAAVTWDGKRAQITDLGSSNGTFVRITGPTPIKHGDHVRMGDQLLRIELGR